MRECDLKARKTRMDVDNFDRTTNIKFHGNYAMMHNDVIMSRNIQDAVRIIDGKKAEQQHKKRKLGHNYEFVDQDTRNVFKLKDVTLSMLKYSYRFNHYGLRDSMFNDNMVEAYCPRCKSIETWDHAVRCPRTLI